MTSTLAALALACLLAGTARAADAPAAPVEAGPVAQVGQPAPAFTLPDTAGTAHSLAAHAGKTVVLEWFNPDCPFVKHAYDTGLLPGLAATWTGQGVVWLRINSGAPGKQGHGAPRNQQAIDAWSLQGPVLLDETGAVGQRYGAKTTPHLYVIDPAGTLVYAGALDNAPLGKVDGAVDGTARIDYVHAALGALGAGKAIDPSLTRPYGCSVKYPD
ncbi:redoxin domain-containing protein [Myxococcota bacterium]|nr:redoxin domain-containing protein [Myxococcota bacterium]